MKGPLLLTTKGESCAVVDKVFDEENFRKFCRYFNKLDFAYRSMTGWQKVWRVSDGQVLSGPAHYLFKAPFNSMMDNLSSIVSSLATHHFENIVGKKGEDWDDYSLTPYIYPSGTKISWHNDYSYSGAAIFYAHERWDPHWGGELLVARTNPANQFMLLDPVDRRDISSILNECGYGAYFSPIPNRLVFTKGDVWHSISRVDPSAGDALRCSVVVFFYKREKNIEQDRCCSLLEM